MDPKKAEMKNIGGKLSEEHESGEQKDFSKELVNLNKITEAKKPQQVIKIKEHDIELLKNELDITYEEAKSQLIKTEGDVTKAIDAFLNDFNLE